MQGACSVDAPPVDSGVIHGSFSAGNNRPRGHVPSRKEGRNRPPPVERVSRMGCDEYADRIGEFAESGEKNDHFESCPECGRRLRRALAIAGAMRDLPRVSLPADAADAIRRSVIETRGGTLRRLVQAAAVLLVVAGGLGLAGILEDGASYRPLEFRVIDVEANGAHDEDLSFEYIFGPERASLVATGGTDRR